MKISMIPNKIVKLIHASKGDTSLRKWAFEPYDNNGAISVSNIKDQLVYKTENGGTEQLLPVNTSTPTTSYFDGTINYGTDTDVEFTYKQSSYTGQARVKSIKGNTLVWNQLLNSSATTSTTNGITFTNNNDGSWTISGTATGTAQKAITSAGDRISATSGHKYLVLCGVKDGSSAKWLLQLYKNNANTLVGTDTVGNGILYTADSTTVNLSIYFTVYSGNTINQKIYPQIFDLTQMGLDTLTVDQFKSLFSLSYYAYNSGSLLNFNGTGIKTTGKNQIDMSYSTDSPYSYNGITFAKQDDGGIKVQGTATGVSFFNFTFKNNLASSQPSYGMVGKTYSYICSGIESNKIETALTFFDVNGSQLSGKQVKTPNLTDITIPNGAEGLRFYVQVYSGAVVDTVLYPMLFVGNDSTFEPYTSSTLSLPISTYFPTGMKSAGTIYDELSDKAITRVGSVDLGTLTWEILSSLAQETYQAVLPNVYNRVSGQSNNAVCAKYESENVWTMVSLSDKHFAIRGDTGKIYVHDSAYINTPSDFKTAMSGVYLNYELATYTEQDIQNASLVCKDIEVPCYLSNGELVCDATEELTSESGFFDAKLKLKDSSSVAYSSKFKLHVEDL